MDLAKLLPEDVLAVALRRIPPRSLAACRCVCKALRDVVDARRLLRTDLLPLSVGGIFINFHDLPLPDLFSRPSTVPAISGRFDYLPSYVQYTLTYSPFFDAHRIRGHCNGLLLLQDCVVNPATRQWDALPPRPSMLVVEDIDVDFTFQEYLLFDPMVSPHYQVFIIPRLRYHFYVRDPVFDKSEWPPSVLALHVFSSTSGFWEERTFIRQGKAAGIVADMRLPSCPWDKKQYTAYWRGALFVLCETKFTMRISLSNGTYKLIEPPTDAGALSKFHLGRSENGLYLASLDNPCLLLVWVLEETQGQAYWVLKHTNCLGSILQRQDYDNPVLGPWVLQDTNFDKDVKYYNERNDDDCLEFLMQKKVELNSSCKEELVEENYEWDSDNDNILDKKNMVGNRHYGSVGILGFHPYKEIVFLQVSLYRGLAYHLKDSKVQDLGYLYRTSYHTFMSNDQYISGSFPYTPCWIGHQKAKQMVEPS